MLSTSPVGDTGNVLIDSLVWGKKWTSASGPLNITVGVLTQGGLEPTAAEISAIQRVLTEFQRVINVTFEFIGVDNSSSADLHFKIYNDSSNTLLGWSVPPGEDPVNGFGEINILRSNYVDQSGIIARGGADYITFVHEFAHAMGLAHPHDNGGGSFLFPGVSEPGHTGFYGLNQGVYTTMSSNDGLIRGAVSAWSMDLITGQSQISAVPLFGSSGTEGLQSGLMALDIQALQHIYGANLSSAQGNDSYTLGGSSSTPGAFTSIWDTGGSDTISNMVGLDSTIDLRAATGTFDVGGGGYLSFAAGLPGGFTIAGGTTIESAIGNVGNDTLIGNEAANILVGHSGNDLLTGNGAKDELFGGAGADIFVFNIIEDSGPTMLSADVIIDFDVLYDRIDIRGVDAHQSLGGNQAFSWGGFISSYTQASQVRAAYVTGDTVLYLNADADMSTESVIVLKGIHLLQADDFLL